VCMAADQGLPSAWQIGRIIIDSRACEP